MFYKGKSMSKFYAVKGEENRIFTEWSDCQAFLSETKGSGNKYKSFHTIEEAEAYIEGRDYYAEVLASDLSQGFAVAFTDGSFEESVGKYSYGVVAISPDGKERRFSGRGEESAFLPTRNIAGEVDGVLTAVKWAFLNGYEKIKIYHDYEGLSAWANGVWSTNSPISVYYVREFAKYKGAVDVKFVKVKGHSNHKYNEMVDQLAKDALFEGKIESLVGRGFKISGTSEYGDIIASINQKAPRAKTFERLGGTVFTYGDEKLAVYPRFSATSIVGTNGFLYCVAVAVALANLSKMGVNRLIDRCLDVRVESETPLNGFEVSNLTLNQLENNFAPAILFSLEEIEKAIKKALSENGKISTYFQKVDKGFALISDCDNKNNLEKAYAFFYEYRVNYFNLNLNREQAEKVIEPSKILVGMLTAEE